MIDEIGKGVGNIIGNAEESKVAIAILLILWVSAFASSFIDNIPYTTAMVIIITIIRDSDESQQKLNFQQQPQGNILK